MDKVDFIIAQINEKCNETGEEQTNRNREKQKIKNKKIENTEE